tara:strand:+ start:700 stop:1134 length:435 start_codon:yes stop_codon:yes gene_type:complete
VDQEIHEQNDRLAIMGVINRYGTTIDAADYQGLADCFTTDALIQYGSHNEFRGGRDVAEFVRKRTTGLAVQQHLLGNHEILLHKDRATATTYLHATQVEQAGAGGRVIVTGGIYRDNLARTSSGWLITKREMEVLWRERRKPTP